MSTTDVSTTVITPGVDYLPPPDPKAVEQAMLIGDISQMTDAQRISYYVATCRSLNLNPLTHPFMALKGDDGKVSLYADKGCAEQLRKLHRVSTKVLSREFLDDLYIVTVLARTPDGREEEAQGVVPITKPKGRWEDYEYRGQARRRFKPDIDSEGQEVMVLLSPAERASALKRAETQAKRRATLGICGLGLPDWDQEPGTTAHPMALPLQTPLPSEAHKTLDEHITDLSEPLDPTAPLPASMRPTPAPTQSASELSMDWLPRIEAAILVHGKERDIEGWTDWAQKRFQKALAMFTLEDWQAFLAQVQEAAARLAARKPQAGREVAQGAVQMTEASTDVPEGTTSGQPGLWQQEEAAEEAKGGEA